MNLIFKNFRNFINNIFPQDIKYSNRYLINFRLKQILFLFLNSFVKDDKRNYLADVIILIHTKRFKNSIDENIVGLISEIKLRNINYKIIGYPPCRNIPIKIKDDNLYYLKHDQFFLFQLIKGIFIGFENSIRQFWISILKECNAKVVITYMPRDELCCACHELKIQVYDMQHGAVHKDHEIYPFYKANRKYLPTLFLAWDLQSIKNAKKMGIAKNYFLLGYPEYQRLKKIKNKFTKNKIALITLPHSINYFYENYNQSNIYKSFNICVPNLIEIMLSNKFQNIFWNIRLHPLTNRKDYKKICKVVNQLFMMGVKIKIDNLSDLSIQIFESDFHVTLNSSVSQKCASLNVFTIATCPKFYNIAHLKSLEKEGICKILQPGYTLQDLSKAIDEALTFSEVNQKTIPELNFDILLNKYILKF